MAHRSRLNKSTFFKLTIMCASRPIVECHLSSHYLLMLFTRELSSLRLHRRGYLSVQQSAPSNLIGANGFAVGGRSLGWRLRHPEWTRP
jgi:hypothetical protein